MAIGLAIFVLRRRQAATIAGQKLAAQTTAGA
jgi:hypothetical protein